MYLSVINYVNQLKNPKAMQENSNLNRKSKSSNPCQQDTTSTEKILLGNSSQPGKLKDEKINRGSNKREDAIDVLSYMSFKL
jgi:hypothetical protein